MTRLQELTITSYMSDLLPVDIVPLFKLRWPELRKLVLGNFLIDADPQFAQFIAAHGRLEAVQIHRCGDEAELLSGALPHLRTLSGNLPTVSAILNNQNNQNITQDITHLTLLRFDFVDTAGKLQPICDMLPNLVSLEFPRSKNGMNYEEEDFFSSLFSVLDRLHHLQHLDISRTCLKHWVSHC